MEKQEIEILTKAIKQFGDVAQLVVAMEECSELIKELSKVIRNGGDIENVAEEIADVEIMIEQLLIIFACRRQKDEKKKQKIKRLARVVGVEYEENPA